MRIAIEDLKLERLAVIYPGTKRYPLGDAVSTVPFEAVKNGMKGLFPA